MTKISVKKILVLLTGLIFINQLMAEEAIDKIAKNISTPQEKNLPLVSYKAGKELIEVKEFDVFGKNTVNTIPTMMSKSERVEKIEERIFFMLMGLEGENGGASKHHDYKYIYESALKKEAAMELFDFLIVPRVVKDDSLKALQKRDSKKYPKKFTVERSRLFEDFKNLKSREISQIANQWMDSVMAKNIVYNDSILNKIALMARMVYPQFIDSLEQYGKNKEDILVVVDNKNSLSTNLRGLKKILKEVKPAQLTRYAKVENLRDLLTGNILNNILTDIALSYKLDQAPKVVARAKVATRPNLTYLQESILFADGNFNPTKDEMIDYFNKNYETDKDLWCKRKMYTYEIFKPFDDSSTDTTKHKIRVAIEMENILQKVKAGEDFEKYARLNHRKMSSNGDLFYIFKEDFGLVGEAAFKMNVGEISEVIEHPLAMSIIKVTAVNEPKPYAFEYVEDVIRQKLTAQKRVLAREKVKKDLFKKYSVKFL